MHEIEYSRAQIIWKILHPHAKFPDDPPGDFHRNFACGCKIPQWSTGKFHMQVRKFPDDPLGT